MLSKSHLVGKRILEAVVDRYYTFRAGWMVGGWTIDKKFVYSMVQQCHSNSQIRVADDKFGSRDFAKNMIRVVAHSRYGLYHMANKGVCSRFEMAEEIVRIMGLQDKIEIKPISSEEFPLPAERSRSEMMHNLKLDLLGLNEMPDWRDSLKQYTEANLPGDR